MYTTIISIGRNYGERAAAQGLKGVPMPDERWAEFKSYLKDITSILAKQIQLSGGEAFGGSFEGESFYNGVPEESFIAQLIHSDEIDAYDYERARDRLKGLAAEFGQDEIAIVSHATADMVPSLLA